MQYVSMFIPLIVVVVTPLFLFGINAWADRVVSKQNKEIKGTSFTVTQNKLSIGSGIFLIVFSGIVTLLFPVLYLCNIPEGPPIEAVVAVSVCFGALAVFSTVFTYGLKRWKIKVNKDRIVYTPLFKKSREYVWDDIVGFNAVFQPYGGATVYRVFVKQTDKKVFSFSSFMVGGDNLVGELRRRGF